MLDLKTFCNSAAMKAERTIVVMLFNGFQKKSQKTPQSEINKAIQLKKEYYATKR